MFLSQENLHNQTKVTKTIAYNDYLLLISIPHFFCFVQINYSINYHGVFRLKNRKLKLTLYDYF